MSAKLIKILKLPSFYAEFEKEDTFIAGPSANMAVTVETGSLVYYLKKTLKRSNFQKYCHQILTRQFQAVCFPSTGFI